MCMGRVREVKKCKGVHGGGHTEVDVDNVAVAVDHDVAVVAVLDLQQVREDGVRCHALREAEAGLRCEGCGLVA